MQDVHTASSSCNSNFAFTALRPRLAPASEGRSCVVLMDLCTATPAPGRRSQHNQLSFAAKATSRLGSGADRDGNPTRAARSRSWI
jgi:hypothetical protein